MKSCPGLFDSSPPKLWLESTLVFKVKVLKGMWYFGSIKMLNKLFVMVLNNNTQFGQIKIRMFIFLDIKIQ